MASLPLAVTLGLSFVFANSLRSGAISLPPTVTMLEHEQLPQLLSNRTTELLRHMVVEAQWAVKRAGRLSGALEEDCRRAVERRARETRRLNGIRFDRVCWPCIQAECDHARDLCGWSSTEPSCDKIKAAMDTRNQDQLPDQMHKLCGYYRRLHCRSPRKTPAVWNASAGVEASAPPRVDPRTCRRLATVDCMHRFSHCAISAIRSTEPTCEEVNAAPRADFGAVCSYYRLGCGAALTGPECRLRMGELCVARVRQCRDANVSEATVLKSVAKDISSFFEDDIPNFFDGAVVDTIKDKMIDPLKEVFKDFKSHFNKKTDSMEKSMDETFDEIGETFSDAGDEIEEFFTEDIPDAADDMEDVFRDAREEIKDFFTDDLKEAVSDVGDAFGEAGDEIGEFFTEGLPDVASGAKEELGSLAHNIKDEWKDFKDEVKDGAKHVKEGFKNLGKEIGRAFDDLFGKRRRKRDAWVSEDELASTGEDGPSTPRTKHAEESDFSKDYADKEYIGDNIDDDVAGEQHNTDNINYNEEKTHEDIDTNEDIEGQTDPPTCQELKSLAEESTCLAYKSKCPSCEFEQKNVSIILECPTFYAAKEHYSNMKEKNGWLLKIPKYLQRVVIKQMIIDSRDPQADDLYPALVYAKVANKMKSADPIRIKIGITEDLYSVSSLAAARAIIRTISPAETP